MSINNLLKVFVLIFAVQLSAATKQGKSVSPAKGGVVIDYTKVCAAKVEVLQDIEKAGIALNRNYIANLIKPAEIAEKLRAMDKVKDQEKLHVPQLKDRLDYLKGLAVKNVPNDGSQTCEKLSGNLLDQFARLANAGGKSLKDFVTNSRRFKEVFPAYIDPYTKQPVAP